ncbi:hypothetical protein K0I73_17375 [Shewanella mesophila]|uniref:hypothetical protein n=1 Tax=Shewanella mesophila TaxID=2864208 RepID=UPI001C65BE50|nr:hypothetical protein [Shewanella mesophila]QYJ85911.1 hypothetical protein K0I73_17375 [Shewanella mesophila]
MKCILTKVILIIILTGQFILTPAMGMPSALLSLLHSQQNMNELLVKPEPVIMSLATINYSSRDTTTAVMAKGKMMSHGSSPCTMSHGGTKLLAGLDCQSLCDIVGNGHCISHGGSTLAALHQLIPLMPLIDQSAAIAGYMWSVQTAELAPLSPPPIS